MDVVTIIQARMGSTRLPGKVMRKLGGETVLARVVHRVRRAKLTGEVIIATTTNPIDDIIVEECRRLRVQVVRGEEDDVLDRYHQAAKIAGAEAVVRITSDCPLIEPEVTDKIIQTFLDHRPDYASNTIERSYPRGLDTEVMTWDALDSTWREAELSYQRAHVTPYIYENPTQFSTMAVTGETDYSEHRWTLDTPEDLLLLRAVYQRAGNDDAVSWREVLSILDREPELMELNQGVLQKALQEG